MCQTRHLARKAYSQSNNKTETEIVIHGMDLWSCNMLIMTQLLREKLLKIISSPFLGLDSVQPHREMA